MKRLNRWFRKLAVGGIERKILILILSVLGYANMWIAIFGDVGVLILCILNAMRLLRPQDS